ncbi:MAG: hypothetical protein IT347_11150 [Candidatus Eisenbacteria bacterium]|nr:hypothetical protein [Candidatus Eisenbacteria bacterium]
MSARARRHRAAAALALALALTAPGAAAAPAEPPFHITADNMTGGRTEAGDVLFLNGNLRVTRGKTVLTADNGRYERSNGLIDLTGNVRLVDSTTTVTCRHATFSENDDRLNLDGDVVIVDREAVLRAPYGWYDRSTGTAHLGGGVTGHEKKQRLSADETTYLRDSMLVKARGNVHGWDDENDVELASQRVDFDRRSRVAVATGGPVMTTRDKDGAVTTMTALLLRLDSARKIAEAVDSVQVTRDTMRVRANRAVFNDSTGHGFLYGSPRAWDNETVVTGDTLETVAVDRRLERVVVHGDAVMDYAGGRADNAGETSRLTGRRVDVFVTRNRIDSLLAVGAARNEYTAPATAGRTQERNLANGDSILVWFKDRKVDRARVVGHAQGEYRSPVDPKDSLAVANEVVKYDGRVIEFVVPKNQIVLEGQAHLTYRELELSSRRVEFDSEKQTLVAQGSPVLLDKGDRVDGHLMTYDLESRTGTIYQAETKYEQGLYRGDRIRKAGENQLDVLHGSYSTCDLDHPHYHFAARQMKIYLKDKLVAKPVVFYLRNVPVLALPFYVFPIKPGRHSGFLFPTFEFGFSNRTGQFLRNAGYYWAINDYMDLSLSGDYYQAQPAWAIRGEGNYKLLYAFDGRFNGRFEHNDATRRDDYVFEADHQQDLTPRTRLVARGNFTSSRDYSASPLSGATLAQRLNRFLNSSVSVSHNADWAAFNGALSRIQDLDADEAIKDPDGTGPLHGPDPGTFASLPNLTTSTPSFAFVLPTRTLGSWGLFKDTKAETALATTYFSLSANFLSYGTRRAFVAGRTYLYDSLGAIRDSTTTLGQQRTLRRGFQTSLSLSDSRRLWGWLNASPTLSSNAAVFDFDELGHRIVPAATWSSQLGLSSTFYGTFKPPVPKLAGLRHIVTPSAAVVYSPEFKSLQYRDTTGTLRNRFNSFGGIGVSGFEAAYLQFGVDQRFQLKFRDGDKITRLDNLLSWMTSGTYDFLWSKRHAPGTHAFGPLNSSLVLQPPGIAAGALSSVVDVYSPRPLRTLSYNIGVNLASSGVRRQPAALAVDQTLRSDQLVSDDDFRESWRLSVAYSYSGGYAGPSWSAQKSANAVLAYELSPNWKFDYSTALDVTRRQILSQRFSLTRRLHCWDAVFTRSFIPGGEAEYYFRLGVHDQKEIYFERGTRVQSFGGIQ